MLSSLRRSWRTWVYELLTYAGPARVEALREHPIGRALTSAAEHSLAGGSVRVAGGAGDGLRLAGSHLPIDHVQGYGLVRGVLEPGVQEALRRHVRPGMVVFDIGANLGFFTLLAARMTGPSGRVEAFEPVAANAAAIRANAALNGIDWITTHELAAGADSGMAELLVPRERSWSHLSDRGWHPLTRERQAVQVVALDDLVESGELHPPDVVKIDVEGSEESVLRGLRRTLGSHPAVIVCELHETNREVAAVLEELDFSVENLDGPEPMLAAGPTHLLARPRAPREGLGSGLPR